MVHVPLLIKSPNNESGHVVKEQVELFDIMATVLDLVGIEAEHTHSQPFVPQLGGATGDPDRAMFCEGGYDTHEPNCFEGFPRGKNETNLMDPWGFQ